MNSDASFCKSEAASVPLPHDYHSNSSTGIAETHCANYSRVHATNHSRSYPTSAAGAGYYRNSRTVFNDPIPETSNGHGMLNGLLDDIGSRVSASIVSDSLVSSASSASSARSVISDPSQRVGSHSYGPAKHSSYPVSHSPTDSPTHASTSVPRPASSNASVCSSRSGFSSLSNSSPTLPSGFKLRCRSLRPGEPLPQGSGWLDMTKGFNGSVNSLKKALLGGRVTFVPNSQGYYLRSSRKSAERQRDVFYLLWREEPEFSPREEWEGLRDDIKYI